MAKNIKNERNPRKLIKYGIANDCIARRTKGTHVILKHPPTGVTTCISDHGELPTGTQRAIIRAFKLMGIVALLVTCYGMYAGWPIIQFIGSLL